MCSGRVAALREATVDRRSFVTALAAGVLLDRSRDRRRGEIAGVPRIERRAIHRTGCA